MSAFTDKNSHFDYRKGITVGRKEMRIDLSSVGYYCVTMFVVVIPSPFLWFTLKHILAEARELSPIMKTLSSIGISVGYICIVAISYIVLMFLYRMVTIVRIKVRQVKCIE